MVASTNSAIKRLSTLTGTRTRNHLIRKGEVTLPIATDDFLKRGTKENEVGVSFYTKKEVTEPLAIVSDNAKINTFCQICKYIYNITLRYIAFNLLSGDKEYHANAMSVFL